MVMQDRVETERWLALGLKSCNHSGNGAEQGAHCREEEQKKGKGKCYLHCQTGLLLSFLGAWGSLLATVPDMQDAYHSFRHATDTSVTNPTVSPDIPVFSDGTRGSH